MNDKIFFTKIEILLKYKNSTDESLPSLTKADFLNAAIMISGNNLIITTKNNTKDTNFSSSETSVIFSLDEISAYKTYNNNTNKQLLT